ncbi:MAG TPA: hypothetical protein VGB04_04970 [Allosphingosinicella sp.]
MIRARHGGQRRSGAQDGGGDQAVIGGSRGHEFRGRPAKAAKQGNGLAIPQGAPRYLTALARGQGTFEGTAIRLS